MTQAATQAIVIGASAGALDALSTLLPSFPKEYAKAVMLVVHIPPDKDSLLAELLQAKCALKVQEAEDETAADAYGPDLIGIVLTGANTDGAKGLKAVIAAGGIGLVQDPTSAYARAMPQGALDACPTAYSLSLQQIASYLNQKVAA